MYDSLFDRSLISDGSINNPIDVRLMLMHSIQFILYYDIVRAQNITLDMKSSVLYLYISLDILKQMLNDAKEKLVVFK